MGGVKGRGGARERGIRGGTKEEQEVGGVLGEMGAHQWRV